MFTSKKPQPRPDHLRWKYLRIAPGEQVEAWIAGALVGVDCHWAGCSKPCRDAMTGGKLPCYWCEQKAKRRWVGYLPLYQWQPYRQIVITVSPDVGLGLVETARLGVWSLFGRTMGVRDPLYVRFPNDHTNRALPVTLHRKGPADIRPWLLHLWQDEELEQFFLPASPASPGAVAERES